MGGNLGILCKEGDISDGIGAETLYAWNSAEKNYANHDAIFKTKCMVKRKESAPKVVFLNLFKLKLS